MKFNILAFGVAKEIFGGASVSIETEEATTAAKLKTILEEKYPRLRQLSSFMLAVNNEYADGDETLGERDEIAVIPPVSGG